MNCIQKTLYPVKTMKDKSSTYAALYHAWMQAVIRDAQKADGTLRIKANGEKL